MADSLTHIFVWHLPCDKRIAWGWDKHYRNYKVYPLLYSSLCAAREIFPPDRFVDPYSFVSSEKRKQIVDRAIVLCDRYYAHDDSARLDYHHFIDAQTFTILVQNYFMYAELVRAVKARFGDGRFVQMPVFSGLAVPGVINKFQRILDIIIEDVNGHHQFHRREIFDVIINLSRSFLFRFMEAVCPVVSPRLKRENMQSVDLLFLALEAPDKRNQALLVSGLSNRFDGSIKWLIPEEDKFGVSKDERMLENLPMTKRVGVEKIPSSLAFGFKWRFGFLRRAFIAWLRQNISRTLRAVGESDFGPVSAFNIAGVLANEMSDVPLALKGARSILDQHNPRLVVLNSLHGPYRIVSSYLEKRKIKVMLLPHGIEDTDGPEVSWRADVIARFGEWDIKELERLSVNYKRRLIAVGGVHLSSLATRRDHVSVPLAGAAREVLYPQAYYYSWLPDSPAEIESDICQMSDACASQDFLLRVRCHPRQMEWNYFDMQWMASHPKAAEWILSDGSSSLVEDILRASIVIIRSWAGASFQCLYFNVPIIAWLPRTNYGYCDKVLEAFPSKARTREDLEIELKRLSEEPAYRTTVIRGQQELLSRIVKNPSSDPYEQAIHAVLEEISATA